MMIGEILDESLSVLAETNCASHRCCNSRDGEGLDVALRVLLLPLAWGDSTRAAAMVEG